MRPDQQGTESATQTSATKQKSGYAKSWSERGQDFPGYSLTVHDMVKFARENGDLCQGRGSAANSVVCFVLGITRGQPLTFKLPFERFLSATRDEEPDIDVDFDSDRREEVIQEVSAAMGVATPPKLQT